METESDVSIQKVHGPGQDAAAQSLLHTRCPSCLKLYTIDPIGPHSGDVEFECTACQAQFTVANGLPHNGEIEARLVHPIQQGPASQTNEINDSQIANELALGAKPELILLWKKIIDDYEEPFLHDAFIQACFQAGALGYAASKYSRILNEFPNESIALKMRTKVRALVSAEADARAPQKPTAVTKNKEKARRDGPFLSLTAFAVLLGTTLTLIGISLPGQKNLLAVGISMLALVIGVRVFYQRNRI